MDYTLDSFTAYAEKAIRDIVYPTTAPGLYEPIRYTMQTGGKRLRPALCMATYSSLTHQVPTSIFPQAAAIEMFHNFTLLHDDVMDHADLRRGRPTVHRRWNENAAILSGDTMLTMAYILLSQDKPEHFAELYALFNKTAMEVYQGQQLDMEFEKRNDVTIDEYLEMIRLKTSVLIGCATRMGAILAGATAEVADAFYTYGESLGLAFQLRDDWLDTFGDPAVFGKEIGGDIANNKKTWLLIMAISKAPALIKSIMGSRGLSAQEKIGYVTDAYVKLGLDEKCNALAWDYASQACLAIDNVNIDSKSRNFFVKLAEEAVSRTH